MAYVLVQSAHEIIPHGCSRVVLLINDELMTEFYDYVPMEGEEINIEIDGMNSIGYPTFVWC